MSYGLTIVTLPQHLNHRPMHNTHTHSNSIVQDEPLVCRNGHTHICLAKSVRLHTHVDAHKIMQLLTQLHCDSYTSANTFPNYPCKHCCPIMMLARFQYSRAYQAICDSCSWDSLKKWKYSPSQFMSNKDCI